MEPKQSATAAVVLAGKPPESKPSSSAAEPWLHNDPWASAAPKSIVSSARVMQDPIQTKHEEQDKRLESLEQKIQVLTEGQQHIELATPGRSVRRDHAVGIEHAAGNQQSVENQANDP